MYFTKAKFHKLPNKEWCAILYASRKHYGNAIGVRRGVCLDHTSLSFISLARFIITNHKRETNKSKTNDNKGI